MEKSYLCIKRGNDWVLYLNILVLHFESYISKVC